MPGKRDIIIDSKVSLNAWHDYSNTKDENNKVVHLSTFHSLSVSLLRKSINNLGYRSNFIIYDARDQLTLIKTIIDTVQ